MKINAISSMSCAPCRHNYLSNSTNGKSSVQYQPAFKGALKASLLAPAAGLLGFIFGGPLGAAALASLGAGIGAAQDDKEPPSDTDDVSTHYTSHYD